MYVDFAWVYYSRQRVKLRAGGIVDSDDLERGWIVGRLVGKRGSHTDDDDDNDEQNGSTIGRNKGGRWGPRGISVSADEGIFDAAGEDARPLTDPAAFEDEISDDEEAPPPAAGAGKATAAREEPPSPWADEDSGSK